ncbi:TonB-dependent hemoglobin/transferrin/lactoferrin family receptor [Chitinimonas lacunae]|uniref:TonB-dependent hemoglobin/transferrin/lactoferrin family receptor n=1 Tax=Chitinimonas lacunae TaxID=1963018 RepID=A0ABV8ML60_9NEIS
MTGARLRPLAALLATLPVLPAFADTPTAAAAALPTVSVTASRLEKKTEETAPNVAVLAPEGTDRSRVRDIQSLVADEPGVSVARDPNRRGNAGFTIRGIDGNRLLMTVDGVRLPDLYQGGGAAISSRDLVELDSLAAVEIVKGPYSGLYGADAIGGVVAYRTLSPQDLLEPNARFGGRASLAYHGADESSKLGGQMALRSGNFAALLSLTARRGHNLDNQGSNDSIGASRTTPNPLDWNSHNALAKLEWQLLPDQRLSLTHEQFEREVDGRLLSNLSASVLAQDSHDQSQRRRSTLAYDYRGSGPFSAARLSWSHQTLDSSELVDEWRPGAVRRVSEGRFDQELDAFDAQLTHRLDGGDLVHSIVWGGEYTRSQTERWRDRTEYRPGIPPNKRVGGEQFPHKTFPDNRNTRWGLFVQDELAWASGMTVTPSLRYDHYELNPSPDALFALSNPFNHLVSDYSDSAWSPRLALSLPLGSGWTGFAQLGSGFRTPGFDDAMLVFANPLFGYEVLPNPQLKAEKSRSLELGTRYRSQGFEWSATAYHNRYRDFIEQVLVSPRDTNHNGVALEYQAQNLDRVRISGLELKAAWLALPRLTLSGALAIARGDITSDQVPLDSVDPLSGHLRADYRFEQWQVGLLARGAARKKRVSRPDGFRTPGWGTLDLTAEWRFGRAGSLHIGVYNLGDRKHWLWSDTRGLAATGAPLDRYSQPGRNVAANLELRF